MTTPIWKKDDVAIDPDIQNYLAGDDVRLDRHLFLFDIQASAAHAEGLNQINLLSDGELADIRRALTALRTEFLEERFSLAPPHEDGHSAIEHYLTAQLGDAGRKIHAGRSRNDQVQVALRLYLRDRLDRLAELLLAISEELLLRAENDGSLVMPGYTHLQRAVPSTVGLWMAGMAESFIDIASLTRQTRSWLNCSPLGTAAGYGVNLPLKREDVANRLGFDRLQINPLYTQNSRGRFELQALSCFGQATLELRRLSWDLSLYSSEEFGFVDLPVNSMTGSSIMPNKRNPDLVELLRAQHSVVQGASSELQATLSLPSGYQRDLQATKAPTIRAIESTRLALALVPRLIRGLAFNADAMRAAISPEMFATDVAIEAAASGQPFREAYRVAMGDRSLDQRSAEQSVTARVSPGACADLQLDRLRSRLAALA